MNRFKVVMTGRNHADWAREALDSVAAQTDDRVDVCVIDDASDDNDELCDVLTEYSDKYEWLCFQQNQRRYALENQVLAWRVLAPQEDDVVVWVDLDDRLATPTALELVRAYYEAGALLTYGSYEPFPSEHPNARTCRPALPYDPVIAKMRRYRKVLSWFNHLRTVSWKVLREISDQELRRSDGKYFRANTDRAVMFPALELAGDRIEVIPDVLYEYRCNSPDAVWKTMNPELVAEDRELRDRSPREAL